MHRTNPGSSWPGRPQPQRSIIVEQNANGEEELANRDDLSKSEYIIDVPDTVRLPGIQRR